MNAGAGAAVRVEKAVRVVRRVKAGRHEAKVEGKPAAHGVRGKGVKAVRASTEAPSRATPIDAAHAAIGLPRRARRQLKPCRKPRW